MSYQNNYINEKFDIAEVYIHEGFTQLLLEKLYQRAAFTLDGEDNVIQKHATHDMILTFNNQLPSPSRIYQFLKFLDQNVKSKDNFIQSNLCEEKELFPSILSKNFILITNRILLKTVYQP